MKHPIWVLFDFRQTGMLMAVIERNKNPILHFFATLSDTVLRITYRDIFGFGMMLIGLFAVWKPAGSITLASDLFGFDPIWHGIWYAVSGWLLSKHGHRSGTLRFIYTMPFLLYLFLTAIWIYQNWERSNPVVLIQYLILYTIILRLIVIRER